MDKAGVPIVPGATEPGQGRRGRQEAGQGDRLPDRLQGGRRGRRQGLPGRRERGRARGRLRGRRSRGREVLQRSDRLPRALPGGPAPRRGPGARRRQGKRHPPRRARLLDPAPPSEADRGVARPPGRRGDARADRQDRHRRRRGRRLPLRRHRRGPAGRRRLLLPRDEHPRSGRALRHRDGHRRSTSFASRSGSPPARSSRSVRRTSSFAATRSSAGSTRRPPTRTSPRPPAGSAPTGSRRGPGVRVDSGVEAGSRGHPDVRPDVRQADRLGPRPREGDGSDAARARTSTRSAGSRR